jgi:tetratricopeptide (TPR) repeat protein
LLAAMVYIDKSEPEFRDRSRGPKRRWTLPPLAAWGSKRIEGLELLTAPREYRVALFFCYRAVRLWATTPPDERDGLFETTVPEWITSSVAGTDLEAITRVMLRVVENPVMHKAEAEIAAACAHVARWAYHHGFVDVEVAFAILACIVTPRDANMAFEAGRAARRQGRYEQAIECFRRSIALARRSGDDGTYASAYIGWGLLEQQRGRALAARKYLLHALRAAHRGKLDVLTGAAHYYLVALDAKSGDFDGGLKHAMSAFRRFHGKQDWLVALANNTGALFTEFSHFSGALPLFEAALARIQRQEDRLAILCNVGRAAAAIGDSARFNQVWLEVTGAPLIVGELAAEALIELASGAGTLQQWRKAQTLLLDAIEASEQRFPRIHEKARALLAGIEEGEYTVSDVDRRLPPTARQFLVTFLARLSSSATGAPE